jgi:hypothetical protein
LRVLRSAARALKFFLPAAFLFRAALLLFLLTPILSLLALVRFSLTLLLVSPSLLVLLAAALFFIEMVICHFCLLQSRPVNSQHDESYLEGETLVSRAGWK